MFAETDFSAFDSTIQLVYREIEYILMAKDHLTDDEITAYIIMICCTILAHVNLDKSSKLHRVVVASRRYSGEPPTSAGNALISDFTTASDPSREQSEPKKEGDDGFQAAKKAWDISQWAHKLGFDLETSWHSDPRGVKFCGRYLSGDGATPLTSVCEVRRTLEKLHITMGVPGIQDKRALLRAKLLSTWCLDKHTPLVAHVVWALWPSVADATAVVTSEDRRKMNLAGGISYPTIEPPEIDDAHYECLRYQGVDPDMARRYDRSVRDAVYSGGKLPLVDFGLSAVKVPLFAVSSV